MQTKKKSFSVWLYDVTFAYLLDFFLAIPKTGKHTLSFCDKLLSNQVQAFRFVQVKKDTIWIYLVWCFSFALINNKRQHSALQKNFLLKIAQIYFNPLLLFSVTSDLLAYIFQCICYLFLSWVYQFAILPQIPMICTSSCFHDDNC